MSRQLRVNKVFTPSPGISSVPEDSIPSNSSSAGTPAGTSSIMDSISSTTSSSQLTTPLRRAQDKQKSVTFGKEKEVVSPAKSESNDKHILAGVVKWFDVKKGYGFIRSEIVGDVDIFVHQRDIHANGVRLLLPGEKVEFEIEREADGRFRALHVTGPGGNYVYGAENVNKLRTTSSRRVPRSPFWFGPPATPGPVTEPEFRAPQNPVYPQPFSPSFVSSTPPISGVSPVPLVAYGGYPNPAMFPPSTPAWMSPMPTLPPDYIPPYFPQRQPVYPFPVSQEYGPAVTGEEGLSFPHVLPTPLQPQRIPHSDSDDLSSPYNENSRQQVRASPRALEIRDPPIKTERTDNSNFLSPQKGLTHRDSLEGHAGLRQSPGKTPIRSSSASSSPSMSRGGSSRTRSSFVRRRRISGAAIDAILNGIDRSSPQTSEMASSSPISSNSKSLPTSRSSSPTGPSSASSSAVSSVASSASTSRDSSPQSKEQTETEPRPLNSDVKPKGLLPPDPKQARAIYLKASQATGDKSTWWRKRVPQTVGSDSTVWVLNDGMFSLGDDARVLRELGFTHIVWIPE